jgi:outer membrane protein assembly factor BamE (lipoprotein component of BamABCDE complex)
MTRILCTFAAAAMLAGCATNNAPNNAAKARISQLREGMTQSQVRSLFGAPAKVDHDEGGYRGHGYIPYYGWRGDRYSSEEVTWEYDNPKLEVTFRRGRSGGWVVKEWDR